MEKSIKISITNIEKLQKKVDKINALAKEINDFKLIIKSEKVD